MKRLLEVVSVRETKVIQTFLELADTLDADFDIIDSLTVLATRCVEILDTAAAGILLADSNGHLHVIAASSEQARLLELFQLRNDQGACTEAFATGVPVTHTNLRTANDRWPQSAPYAVQCGFCSVHAIPLRLRGQIVGALDLFRSDPSPLDRDDLALARAFADFASITILQAQAATEARVRDGQLQHALDSRIVIEQAKGMLAEYAHIDMASAFAVLRTQSRNSNTKLTDLATQIVDGRVDLKTLAKERSEKR